MIITMIKYFIIQPAQFHNLIILQMAIKLKVSLILFIVQGIYLILLLPMKLPAYLRRPQFIYIFPIFNSYLFKLF